MGFGIFGLFSLFTVGITIIWSNFIYPHQKKLKRCISALKLRTIGIFLAIFLLYIPICYHWDEWRDEYTYIRPVLLALVNAVRVFLLDIDFDVVEKALPTEPAWFKALFSLYAMILYVVAPVLTFSNLLAVFKNLSGEIQVRVCRRRKIYVMSELNPQSITMANSIVDSAGQSHCKRPLIVFCNVFAQNEEQNYELLLQTREISAICLKKDASHITFGKKGTTVEIFLIGENETENMSQAIRLTNKFKETSREISLYVFSSDPTTDYILDSLDLGDKLLSDTFCTWLETHAEEILRDGKWEEKNCSMFGNFSIHHIDPTDILVRDVLTHNDYADFKEIQYAAQNNGTISITILGMGNHGTQFLKTAIWFYQRYGIRVEFNIFDLGDKNGDPSKRLGQECPELICPQQLEEDGDAQYDIAFFAGIDCFSSDFDDAIVKKESDRFDKTNLVFIALGDDDRNIRAAMVVEKLFARKKIESNLNMPFIYAIVYNDEKAANLNVHNTHHCDHIDNRIRYVGARLDQYSYDIIENYKRQKEKAIEHHLDWLTKECQLRNAYTIAASGQLHEHDANYTALKNMLDKEQEEEKEKTISWADSDYYKGKNGIPNYDGPINTQKVKETVEQYMRDSYCRKSSLSKAMHKEALEQIADITETCARENHILCDCSACVKTRITEHMRWNAYMRSLGYKQTNGKKNHTAKLHPCLKSWYDLPCRDRYKD